MFRHEDDGDLNECDRTFINPSLVVNDKESEHTNDSVVEEFVQCDQCEFTTPHKLQMEEHKFENHSVKGKYVCFNCKKKFDKKRFKSHKYHGC